MGIPVFFIEPTGLYQVSLRRYESGSTCPNGGYHQAMTFIGEELDPDRSIGDDHPHDDPRWPTACEKCGKPFTDDDEWQRFRRAIYRRHGSDITMTLAESPPGACWNADWMTGIHVGPDGRCLIVKLPDGHEWVIDSRARNCTLPDDNVHKCWVRHGRPEDGTLHVDKNGVTCSAGAGSIDSGKWHGFLHHGQLTG